MGGGEGPRNVVVVSERKGFLCVVENGSKLERREGIEMSKYIPARIEALQQELEQLRKALDCEVAARKRKTRLRDPGKGIEVIEEDIVEVKRHVEPRS